MSTRSPYGRIEKSIAAHDAGTVYERWLYGRRLVCDPSATDQAGSLRPGKLAELVEAASRAGVRLSEEEILGRLRAARAYPAESQIRRALAACGAWDVLTELGFPEYDAEPGELPYDPRTAGEKLQQAERQLALGEPDQLALFELFPEDRFSELSSLADLAKYAAESADITRRFRDRDDRRAGYLASLVDAADGDMSATWAEAQAALDAKDGRP
jgi:hypothetical protein